MKVGKSSSSKSYHGALSTSIGDIPFDSKQTITEAEANKLEGELDGLKAAGYSVELSKGDGKKEKVDTETESGPGGSGSSGPDPAGTTRSRTRPVD